MLDHRLKETVDNDKNGSSQESGFDAKTLELAQEPKAPESKLPPAPKHESKPTPSWERLRQKWDNLGFRSKLALLLVSSAAIPVIVVTQAMENVTEDRLLASYEDSLKQELAFLNTGIEKVKDTNKVVAGSIANSVESAGFNLNNPSEVATQRAFLTNLVTNTLDEDLGQQSFQIITDVHGRTVAQNIQVSNEDFSSYPPLPADDKEPPVASYKVLSLPPGINLGNLLIVKNALSSGNLLSGAELLKVETLQRLGLDKQANIGIRKQKTEGLPEPKKPFPEGTYDVDKGKLGLVLMAVQPIRINGEPAGTAIVGTLLNRNFEIVDQAKKDAGISTATLFAKDWRVSTNVPYTDKKTRAIGTRVSREVAEKVLNRGEIFLGEANIIGTDYLTGYGPLYDHQKQLNPSQAKPVGITYVGEPKTQVQQTLDNLRLTGYGIGGGMLLLAGLVALPIAGSFSRPLRRLSGFAQQVAAGKQGVRLEATERQDEIGVLSREMNQMATSIETNQEAQVEQSRLFSNITLLRVQNSQDLDSVFNKALKGGRKILKADRVVVYSFNENWQGTIIAESVAEGWPRALGAQIDDHCFPEKYVERYRKGRVQATENIYTAGLTECHLKELEPFAVKANLVVPILQGDQLFGLLIAHQCSKPRTWQQSEINFLRQLASQFGVILDRVTFLEQQKTAKETLQRRALELLMEVDPLSKGDLTIRASVTDDEIGTVADSYNSTIGSLRKIVTQVQAAAKQVAENTSSNESSVQELSTEALRQTEEISAALDQIEEMSESIRAVAINAEQAEAAVKQAAQTVEAGDAAMNRTVDGFKAIRETVAQTSKKVKRLGESSQKISKVVNLIGTFADQTNLLALNAAIEAANAGEQGRGFAVVAERVRSLARQSTEATAEIEQLVMDIQSETNEVVAAMEAGTEQVVTGTKLVDETRQSLNQITTVSIQIGALVQAIAEAAVEQYQASESVTQTMSDVAAISSKTSTEATQVTASFKELLVVAQELQATAGQFKVS
jgi:methyl-accepting chemotaxis protein PixJ